MNFIQNIRIVDCGIPGWEDKIVGEVEHYRNLVALLDQSNPDLPSLCRLLGCSERILPERLTRWGVHGLNDALEKRDYEWLLFLLKNGRPAYFVEQIQLKHVQPPRLGPYLVYCELRGVISNHDSLDEGKSAFRRYAETFRRAKSFPLAGVYIWQGIEWVPFQGALLSAG